MKCCLTATLLLAATCWLFTVFGQVIQSTITGNVTDASGASVPDVAVTARNEQTGITNRTSSTGAGVYSLPDLPAGIYSISADRTGFQRLTIQGVTLGSAQTVRQDIKLTVGAVSESVEVKSDAPLVSTDSQSVQTSFTTQQIQQLPQAIQDIDGFFIMAAGVGRSTFNSAPQFAGSTHWGGDNFTLNGVSVNDPGNGGGSYSFGLGGVNLPSLGSLQEVTVGGINMDGANRNARCENMTSLLRYSADSTLVFVAGRRRNSIPLPMICRLSAWLSSEVRRECPKDAPLPAHIAEYPQ